MQLKDLAVSGTPDKSYHLGNFFLDYMNQNPEDHVWQIDAGTGQKEMKSSVKSRSIRLARCFQKCGLQPGDVLVVSGRNHLDVHIPFYAAFMTGLPLAGVDPIYKYDEVRLLFDTVKPKMAICEVESYEIYVKAASDLGLNVNIATFGPGDNSLEKFQTLYDDKAPENEFKVAVFDTDKVYAWLISTSGTTGLPKVAAFKHQPIIQILRLHSLLRVKEVNHALNLSSVQWISSYFATMSMITANHIKVQTSLPVTVEHAIEIINKYKPVISTGSPGMLSQMLKHKNHCDMSCFDKIVITGSSITEDVMKLLKSRMRKDSVVWNLFAQTECIGPIFHPAPDGPVGNVGVEIELVKIQLVDPKTGDIITEPHKVGELWTKGPRFDKYYNNPEATSEVITKDGWFKTGDLLYKDDNGYYFFVDRMSMGFKVRRYYVMPMEVEQVIISHPGVLDACVLGVPHPEDGKRAMACVVRRPGSTVTAQEIKDLVAIKLSIHKQLHGGVMFVDYLPRTISGKVARAKVKEMVLKSKTDETKEIKKTEGLPAKEIKTAEDQTTEIPNSGNVKKLINTFQQMSNSNKTPRYISSGRL